MSEDVMTIIWKELRELFFQRGRFRGGMVGIIFFVAVFGILMPIQTGPDWINSPIGLVYWAWVPFLLVSGVVADSFAGERERHTLETLLASRLSDRTILLGKMATSILYGWGLTMMCVLLGLVTLNVVYAQGHLLLYPVMIAIGIIVLTFLVATLSSALGVLVSLRASTVRQAQQTFSIAFFVLFIPLFLIPLLPETWKIGMMTFLMGLNFDALIILIVLLLVLLDVILISLAMARFKRPKMILS